MSLPRKMTVNCSKCGKALTATVFESVNSDYADNLAMQIISGELFNVECPHCHFVSHLEYDFLYHDIKHGAMIWVVHKTSPDYASKIAEVRTTQKLPYKTLRIVEDMNALKEKVSCLEQNRDDRIIELCKVFTAYNLLAQNPDFEFRNAFYTAISGTDMIYLYDSEGNDMCCELPEKAYEYIKELYYSSQYASQFDNNYAIVDYAWAESILTPLMQAESERIDNAAATDAPATVTKAKVICPNCNSELPDDSEFCHYCGSKITTADEAPIVPGEQKMSPAPLASAGTTSSPLNVETASNTEAHQKTTSQTIDDELGLIPNKPIYTRGVELQRHYLQCLHSIGGETLKWSHRGSISVDGIPGLVDIFDAYLPSGTEYKTVYLAVGDTPCQTCAPKGFSYVNVPYIPAPTNQPTKKARPTGSKKAVKISLIILAIVAVLAICAVLAVPEIKYQKACSTLNNGSYDSAIQMFEGLNGYKDSEDKIKEAMYQKACSALNSGSYSSAIQMFEDLNGYKNSKDKINEAMYSYVLKHKNNNDTTTFDYLKKLKKQDYKDSSSIYEKLYAWEITVIAVNSSQTDETTNKSSISKSKAIYFHIELTGGEPNASVRLTAKPIYPDGDIGEYTFDNKWTDGETGWYGWDSGLYNNPEYGAIGTLQCKFYDDDGNLIGMGSVRITD